MSRAEPFAPGPAGSSTPRPREGAAQHVRASGDYGSDSDGDSSSDDAMHDTSEGSAASRPQKAGEREVEMSYGSSPSAMNARGGIGSDDIAPPVTAAAVATARGFDWDEWDAALGSSLAQ